MTGKVENDEEEQKQNGTCSHSGAEKSELSDTMKPTQNKVQNNNDDNALHQSKQEELIKKLESNITRLKGMSFSSQMSHDADESMIEELKLLLDVEKARHKVTKLKLMKAENSIEEAESVMQKMSELQRSVEVYRESVTTLFASVGEKAKDADASGLDKKNESKNGKSLHELALEAFASVKQLEEENLSQSKRITELELLVLQNSKAEGVDEATNEVVA